MTPNGPVTSGKKSLRKESMDEVDPVNPEPDLKIYPDLAELKTRRDATMKMIKKFGWFTLPPDPLSRRTGQ